MREGEFRVRANVRHEDLEDELLALTDEGYEVVAFLPVQPTDPMILPGLVTLVCRKRVSDYLRRFEIPLGSDPFES